MRRASFACARCEPHAFLRPACAARAFARATLLRCARSPHRIEMAKRQRPRSGIAGVSSKSRSLRAVSQFCGLLRLSCLRMPVVTLAGPRYWRFSPAPTSAEVRLIRLPPRVQGRGGITVTGSRGIPPHSSGSEGHDAPEQPAVQFAIRLCGYSMASSRGGQGRNFSPYAERAFVKIGVVRSAPLSNA